MRRQAPQSLVGLQSCTGSRIYCRCVVKMPQLKRFRAVFTAQAQIDCTGALCISNPPEIRLIDDQATLLNPFREHSELGICDLSGIVGRQMGRMQTVTGMHILEYERSQNQSRLRTPTPTQTVMLIEAPPTPSTETQTKYHKARVSEVLHLCL